MSLEVDDYPVSSIGSIGWSDVEEEEWVEEEVGAEEGEEEGGDFWILDGDQLSGEGSDSGEYSSEESEGSSSESSSESSDDGIVIEDRIYVA